MANNLPSENHRFFSKICEEHDIVKLLDFIKLSENLNDIGIHCCFYVACMNHSNRKNEFIELFLNNSKLMKSVNIPNICSNMIIDDNFEIFKKLTDIFSTNDLLSQYLEQIIENKNTVFFKKTLQEYQVNQETLHLCLVKACECGQLDIVRYLFEIYDLDIHFNYDLAIRRAGIHHHNQIVKYLLEDNNLKEKANPSTMNDDLSITAIMQDNLELIDYLYNQYGMIESARVKEYKQYQQNLVNFCLKN